MKSILLSDRADMLESVYTEKIISILADDAGLDRKLYNSQDIRNNINDFADTEYIFSTWGMPVFTEEEIKQCFPKLRAVFYAAGSVQHFARPFLNSGVKVFSAWAANAVPVAEYTVAQIILANKGFFKVSSISNREDYAEMAKEFKSYIGNYDSKIGIIGAGMIGKLVIKMLKSYNLDILVFDPFLSEAVADKLGVKKTSLENLFKECNVVSNHLANNEQTKGMLNGELFSKLPMYSTFLNTGRGAQIVENDLIQVLKSRKDIVAVLDVTDPEPPVDNSEIYSLDNCILTPHIAGSAGNEVHRMAEYMLNEYELIKDEKKCNYEVTVEMLKTMA